MFNHLAFLSECLHRLIVRFIPERIAFTAFGVSCIAALVIYKFLAVQIDFPIINHPRHRTPNFILALPYLFRADQRNLARLVCTYDALCLRSPFDCCR